MLFQRNMFITHPYAKSVTPKSMLPDGATQWRSIEVLVYAPWFVVSAGQSDFSAELFICTTWCVGSAKDLREMLADPGTYSLVSLTCVRPTHFRRPGFWEHVEISKVWSARRGNHDVLIMADLSGEEFLVGAAFEETLDVKNRKLLVELPRIGV